MRTWTIAIGLCFFLFIVPLQCYILGNDYGMGFQGAVYRFQMSTEGVLFIPITHEIEYVTTGLYSGKTALSVMSWTGGTIVLVLTTIFSLICWNTLSYRYFRFIVLGITGSSLLYLSSCIFQYGLFFSGPAGTCLPLGIIIEIMFGAFIYFYKGLFFTRDSNPDLENRQ